MKQPVHSEFEEFFKASFEAFEEQPSDFVWSGLEERLNILAAASLQSISDVEQEAPGALNEQFSSNDTEPSAEVWAGLNARLDALIPEAPGELAEDFAGYQEQPSSAVWTGLSDQLNVQASAIAEKGELKYSRRLNATMVAMVVLLFMSLGLGSYIFLKNQETQAIYQAEVLSHQIGLNSVKPEVEQLETISANRAQALHEHTADDISSVNEEPLESVIFQSTTLIDSEAKNVSNIESDFIGSDNAVGMVEAPVAGMEVSSNESVSSFAVVNNEPPKQTLIDGQRLLALLDDESTNTENSNTAMAFSALLKIDTKPASNLLVDGIDDIDGWAHGIEGKETWDYLYSMPIESSKKSAWEYADFSFKRPNIDNRSRWSITPTMGYASHDRIISPSEDAIGTDESVYSMEFFNQNETVGQSWSAGAYVSYELSRLMSVRTGLLLNNWSMHSSYDILLRTNADNIYEGNHYASNNTSEIVYSIREHLGTDGDLQQVKMAVEQQIRYLKVPVELELGVAKGDWELLARAGVSWNQLLSHRLRASDAGDVQAISSSSNAHLKSYLSWQAGLVVGYRLSDQFSLELSPSLSRSLSAMNSGQVFEVQPVSVGLSAGIKFRY